MRGNKKRSNNNPISLTAFHVLNNNNGKVASHQRSNNSLDMAHCQLLPLLPHDLGWNKWQTLDDEAILVALVLTEVGHLGVDGRLVLNDLIDATTILLKDENPVLQNSSRVALLQKHHLRRAAQTHDDRLRTVKEMEHELEPGEGGEVNVVALILEVDEAGQ